MNFKVIFSSFLNRNSNLIHSLQKASCWCSQVKLFILLCIPQLADKRIFQTSSFQIYIFLNVVHTSTCIPWFIFVSATDIFRTKFYIGYFLVRKIYVRNINGKFLGDKRIDEHYICGKLILMIMEMEKRSYIYVQCTYYCFDKFVE